MSNKILLIRVILSIILSSYSLTAKSQLFNAEQNPPSIKWKEINTRSFQLIYPASFEDEAQRMANVLEGIIAKVSYSLGKKPKRISIIFQNQGTSSNGFVQLAPRRSEYFTTPSQSFDFQNWLNGLAVHELRHVVQFDKVSGVFTRFPFEALGLAIFGITLPSWFFEGDAVTTETALSDAGRGRIPEWYISLRTNTLSNKNYSYSKDYFGSVKDFTPGYYQLGFFMNTKLRRDYGYGITDSILSRVSGNRLRPYNFSNSVKKFTGLNTKQLHDSTIKDLKNLWLEQLNETRPLTYLSINKRKNKTPENFLLPTVSSNGSIYYLKQSIALTPAIYEQDTLGKTTKILNIGSQEIPWFSFGGDKIVWDEFRYDARFHQRSFNVINIYNVNTKIRRQITHRSRLFAPALSPDGRIIAAIEVTTSNKISLVELNSDSGEEIRRYNSPENCMLQMPVYNATGKNIAVVAVSNTAGKSIYEIDRSTGKFRQLMPFRLQEILRPMYADDQIIFKAHFNGIDNIYRLNPSDKQIYQLSSVKFGAANPYYDSSSRVILFNNYTVDGYDISSLRYSDSDGKSISSLPDVSVNYADPLVKQEGGRAAFENMPNLVYPSKRFREPGNLFYFHSIVPVLEDNPYFNDNNFGLILESDNKLNTLSFYTGYLFNSALRKSEYEAGLSYSKFFPVFNVTYNNRARLLNRRATTTGGQVLIPVSWRENEFKANISIPLLANQFNSTYRFSFSTGTSYTSRYAIKNDFAGLIKSLDFPMHYELSASRNNRRSSRDLAPKWGQNITLEYHHFPFENQIRADLFTFKSTFYFPGIVTNHSFQTSLNFQKGNGAYSGSVDIPRVSGYSFLAPVEIISNTLLLDYRFPLFYPDWELGPLAYIKRFKGGLFADFENIEKRSTSPLRSYGFELRADMNLLRFPLPNFDLGGKVIFLNEKSKQNPIFETVATYNF